MVRQNMSAFLQIGRIFDKDGRGVESESSNANATPMDVDGVGKGKGKGCFVCGRPGYAAKDCKFNQARGKGQGKGKTKSTSTDKNTPAKFEECRHCGKNGHKWADCRKRLAEAKDKKVHAVDGAPSTATVAAVEDTEVIDEAGIANGLAILPGRKVMVSYDVLGPGRMILHAQTPFVQSDVKRPLLSVGKLTISGAEVRFGSKGSWIDLHTDSGVQRVLVRVKGKTFGLTIQKTDAWIIPGNSDPAPRAVVAPVEEEIGRGERPNPAAPAAQECSDMCSLFNRP